MPAPSPEALRREQELWMKKQAAAVAKMKQTNADKKAANAGKPPTEYRFGRFVIPLSSMEDYERTKDVGIALRVITWSQKDLHPAIVSAAHSNPSFRDLVSRIMDNAIEKKNTGSSSDSPVDLLRKYLGMLKTISDRYLAGLSKK
jgi:hypothetical protein